MSGTTFAPGDAEQLARTLRRNLQNRANAARLTAAGKARVYQRYPGTAMAEAYESHYETLRHTL